MSCSLEKTLLGLGLLLVSIACQVHGQCSIRRAEVEGSDGVFTYRDAQGRNQLLRVSSVAKGVTLRMFCGNQFQSTTCQENHHFEPTLPMKCNEPMIPVVRRLTAGNSCRDTLYAIGHIIENQFLEIYRSCFDSRNVRVHYAEALIYAKNFYPQRPNMMFGLDGIITPKQFAALIPRQIYATFKKIYGESQTYIPNNHDIKINRGHLVASADLLFADQSRGTFKAINVVPQFKSINDGNWEAVERWVRAQIPNSQPLRVRTGGLEVLMLPHSNQANILKPAYLAENNKYPVPKWTYKLVSSAHNTPLFAILTYNYIFGTRPIAPPYCRVISCPNTLRLVENAEAGYTYCCDPQHFAEHVY